MPLPKNVTEKIKQSGTEISNEITGKIATYMVGALGVVAGLAWNDAIKALIEFLFPLAKNTIIAQFIYAMIISVIVIIISVIITKAAKRAAFEKEEKQDRAAPESMKQK